MSRLFDPENKFWNFIGKIADVTCMSFLWVGTSLPLVTMGAATTAFYSYTMHQVRDTEGGILSGYFKAFRHNFKKATALAAGGGGPRVFRGRPRGRVEPVPLSGRAPGRSDRSTGALPGVSFLELHVLHLAAAGRV